MYITITRPDIAYVVGVVSQFMQKPRTIHLDTAYRIIRYLKVKGSPGKGLLFPSSSSLQMTGDSDADWARDALDRKSITGNKLYCHWSLYRRRARSSSLKVIGSKKGEIKFFR